jgi:hypothetical protein
MHGVTSQKTSITTNIHVLCKWDLSSFCGILRSSLPTFRDKVSVPRSNSPRRIIAYPLKMGKIGCPETSAINCHSLMFNIPGQEWSHMGARWSARGKKMRVRGTCGGSRRMGLVSLASVVYIAKSAWYRPFCRTCKHGDLRLPHWGSLWNRHTGRGRLYRGISPFCPELGTQTSPYCPLRLDTLEHKKGCC